MHLALNGSIGTSGSLATIAIQNLFDPSQNYLDPVQREGPRDRRGARSATSSPCCLPASYEVIVQSPDPSCHPEQPWYKVIVRPNETVELQVNLVCGDANGGLDVIVTVEEPPVVQSIDFLFQNGDQANKFICTNDAENPFVQVRIGVTDSDTPCAQLAATWSSGPCRRPAAHRRPVRRPHLEVDGVCYFTNWLRANDPALNGDYEITFSVNDAADPDTATHTTNFTFPVHLRTCTFPAP